MVTSALKNNNNNNKIKTTRKENNNNTKDHIPSENKKCTLTEQNMQRPHPQCKQRMYFNTTKHAYICFLGRPIFQAANS